MTTKAPTLRFERSFVEAGHRLVAGARRGGPRGSLAGPVRVGVVVIDAAVGQPIRGVRDSKLLHRGRREWPWCPRSRNGRRRTPWVTRSAEEIDAIGIMAALRLAGAPRLGQACPALPDIVILDGNHDWLTVPASGPVRARPEPEPRPPAVLTLIKADLQCSSVAAASVLAKVERDAMMTGLAADFPEYGWADNKGYSTPEHRGGAGRHGRHAATAGPGGCPSPGGRGSPGVDRQWAASDG